MLSGGIVANEPDGDSSSFELSLSDIVLFSPGLGSSSAFVVGVWLAVMAAGGVSFRAKEMVGRQPRTEAKMAPEMVTRWMRSVSAPTVP